MNKKQLIEKIIYAIIAALTAFLTTSCVSGKLSLDTVAQVLGA